MILKIGVITTSLLERQNPFINTIEITSSIPFTDSIMNLYIDAEKTTVVNNGINYEYAPSVSMMKDVGGNIRYYGADPDNYIYFNCTDYSNQSDSTCEKWRIIGIFDGKIKIMRNESIGKYSWDTSGSGVNSGDGINQWGLSNYSPAGSAYEGADLMRLLNPGYESNSVSNSLYYTGGKRTCYNGGRNATTACNFTTTGLKNNTTRNMISETIYYLGAYGTDNVYSNQIYGYERSNSTGSVSTVNRTTTWSGKVALPYPSDYGYAADLKLCTQMLSSYYDSTCINNNWMKQVIGNTGDVWLITPTSSSSTNTWIVRFFGSTYIYNYSVRATGISASNANNVIPTLYLIPEVVIDQEVGNGDANSPYQIKIS